MPMIILIVSVVLCSVISSHSNGNYWMEGKNSTMGIAQLQNRITYVRNHDQQYHIEQRGDYQQWK